MVSLKYKWLLQMKGMCLTISVHEIWVKETMMVNGELTENQSTDETWVKAKVFELVFANEKVCLKFMVFVEYGSKQTLFNGEFNMQISGYWKWKGVFENNGGDDCLQWSDISSKGKNSIKSDNGSSEVKHQLLKTMEQDNHSTYWSRNWPV